MSVTARVGDVAGPAEVAWDERDAMLYALSVGAGTPDATRDLDLTTENTEGIELRTLPAFGLTLMQRAIPRTDFGEVDRTSIRHVGQSLELHAPIPPRGSGIVDGVVTSVHDAGRHAVVEYTRRLRDDAGTPLLTAGMTMLLIGYAGVGAAAESRTDWTEDGIEQAERIQVATRQDQALLYRLNGDRNPLHSDPRKAERTGSPRPILHGLGTLGIAARVLERLGAVTRLSARFSAPVLPGEPLEVLVWGEGAERRYRVVAAGDRIVIDRGTVRVGAEAA